mgnify:CR=1 FL=1
MDVLTRTCKEDALLNNVPFYRLCLTVLTYKRACWVEQYTQK